MTKYLLNRILRSVISITIVIVVVMVMIYTCLDKTLIFQTDPSYAKKQSNGKVVYQLQQWERYGYIDYVPYTDWLLEQLQAGEIDQEIYDQVKRIGNTAEKDSELVAEYVAKFEEHYRALGYDPDRKDADLKPGTQKPKDGGEARLYAVRDIPVTTRLWKYLTGLVSVDNIHYVKEDIEDRGLTFTWYDPAYGGEKFSPALMGNGTKYKYLLYCDDNFPFIHQNLVRISLGESYTVNRGIDVWTSMTQAQGSFKNSLVTYPTGKQESTADDLHSASYLAGSLETGTAVIKANYTDDYTQVETNKNGFSRMGYSFVIGICSVLMAYLLAVPLGITMALKKDKLLDKLGTFYIVFIMAVPSLGYIFLFKAIGGNLGLPTTFDMENPTWLMFVLPVVSLALPSIANLMKWLRRYMIDQMNADYVKFARSGGLSEGQIFTKHVLKNAIIPIVHGIPSSILFSLTGAIITERVYVVPGVGNVLTKAINQYDNGVIVGVTLFYAVLSVVSIILGDVLMSMMDPRISFTAKQR